MQSPNKSRKILIITGAVFLLLIVVTIIMLARSSKPKITTYKDPLSHETISNPQGKAPDKYGIPADTPSFLGVSGLLDHGITSDQLYNLKRAFYKYSQAQKQPISEVSIDVDHITTDRIGSDFYILFNVQFDRKDLYSAKAKYLGLTGVDLVLQDQKNGKTIYDSGAIDYAE